MISIEYPGLRGFTPVVRRDGGKTNYVSTVQTNNSSTNNDGDEHRPASKTKPWMEKAAYCNQAPALETSVHSHYPVNVRYLAEQRSYTEAYWEGGSREIRIYVVALEVRQGCVVAMNENSSILILLNWKKTENGLVLKPNIWCPELSSPNDMAVEPRPFCSEHSH